MGFGSDFSGITDLDANLTFLTGDGPEETALAQAIARRFTTPRGGLFYDPDYGLDLRSYLADSATTSEVIPLLEAEARKDERVNDCTATITEFGPPNSRTWNVSINCKATNGLTYTFTVNVSAVTVTLLTKGS